MKWRSEGLSLAVGGAILTVGIGVAGNGGWKPTDWQFIATIAASVMMAFLIGYLLYPKTDPETQDDGRQRKKMERAESRKEDWLQEALNHAEAVLRRINAARAAAIQDIGVMEPEQLQIAILKALTPDYSPEKLGVVEALADDTLMRALANVQEAFSAVRVAQMDLAHGAAPASEEYEPTYVVQWYTTQVMNFADVARRLLAGT